MSQDPPPPIASQYAAPPPLAGEIPPPAVSYATPATRTWRPMPLSRYLKALRIMLWIEAACPEEKAQAMIADAVKECKERLR